MHFGKVHGVVGVSTLQSLLILKKGIWTSDYKSNEPPPKFIQSLFLYIPYLPNHAVQLFLRALGGCHPQRHNFWTFRLFGTKCLHQSFIGCIWGNGSLGMGLVALQSLLTIKKGTHPFNFQSNELFLNFPWHKMAISKLKSDTFWENVRCVGKGVSTLQSLWILESTLELLITNSMCPL